jgi:GNAT superfamily N-acetyltransferase
VEIRRARPEDGPAIAETYLESFRTALPSVRLAHADDEIRRHFSTVVTHDLETWVASVGDRLVGFLALGHDNHVDHLYVRPSAAGQGIGTALLDRAKQRRPSGLQLWAFQVNTAARRFYERRGFSPVKMTDGRHNQEREPDVLYAWAADV